MGIQDLFITPIYILLFLVGAYLIRPYVTTPETKRFFIPALLVRFVGAIGLGLVYQFYYNGGDTFNYFTHGSKWIWEAFKEDWVLGLKLLMEQGGVNRVGETYAYSQNIWYYKDPQSFLIVRLVSVIDLFTFHTYTATALFFALFSFSGLWAFFTSLVIRYPKRISWVALALLFVPSTVFWGAGILKDTVTLGAIGWLTYAWLNIIEFKRRASMYWVLVVVASLLIYFIKSYIIICYIPMVSVWLYWKYQKNIRGFVLKLVIAPFLLAVFLIAGYSALEQISSYSDKYSLDEIATRAAITAYDIRYGWGARTGGDGGYDIGIPDGTWFGMLKLMPQAVNVSLFRPYLWEVKNPLMLLNALESLFVLILTIYFMVWRRGIMDVFSDPFLIFCLVFALIFAFAVGISTANFGTLIRYKMPTTLFYSLAIVSSVRNNLKYEE